MIKSVVVCLAILFLSGCVRRTHLIRAENEVYVEGLFSVWGTWVKDKGEKLDLKLNIENSVPVPIVIRTRDIKCSKGERWGDLYFLGRARHSRRVVLHPRQRRTFVVACRLAHRDIEGDFRILVGHIFEDPMRRADGVAELLATDIEWVVPEAMIR